MSRPGVNAIARALKRHLLTIMRAAVFLYQSAKPWDFWSDIVFAAIFYLGVDQSIVAYTRASNCSTGHPPWKQMIHIRHGQNFSKISESVINCSGPAPMEPQSAMFAVQVHILCTGHQSVYALGLPQLQRAVRQHGRQDLGPAVVVEGCSEATQRAALALHGWRR